MSIKSVLDAVLEKVSISEAKIKRLEKLAKELVLELNSIGLNASIGGSLAKGTMIKTDSLPDIDIFIVHKYSEDILKLGESLKKVNLPGPLKLVHGSRDYYQIPTPDAIFEIIPVVENKDPQIAENVTDVSLAHVKFVKSEIATNPELKDEIKLAKAFLRAQKIYGAESYVKGFSGYSLEVLVIHFKSFVKFLKGINKIRIIDPKKYYKGKNEILREINQSKLQGPVTVIDPTNKYRNVNAGLGEETFERFLEISKRFLKKSSIEFFEKKKLDLEAMKNLAKKKKATFIEVNLSTNRQEGDIAGTKCKKFFDFYIRELMKKGQKVLAREYEYKGSGQKAKGYLIVNEKTEYIVKGPSVGLEEASAKFKESRGENAYKKGKFWYAKEETGIKKVFEKCSKMSKDMGVKVSLN